MCRGAIVRSLQLSDKVILIAYECKLPAKGPNKAGVRDLQPMVRKCTSVPSNTIPRS